MVSDNLPGDRPPDQPSATLAQLPRLLRHFGTKALALIEQPFWLQCEGVDLVKIVTKVATIHIVEAETKCYM